jgi:prophage regulatory protein
MDQQENIPMNVKQAAEFTGYSVTYLYKLIHAGKIPYYKPETTKSSRVFFSRKDLSDFIFRNRIRPDYEIQEEAEKMLLKRK